MNVQEEAICARLVEPGKEIFKAPEDNPLNLKKSPYLDEAPRKRKHLCMFV